MRKACDRCSLPNLVLHYGGGGIENVAGVLALTEMLLPSHAGVIRCFPVGPRAPGARLTLRTAVGETLELQEAP